jgi:hypothetical protein
VSSLVGFHAGASFPSAKALALARKWPESANALNRRSWSVSRESGRDPYEYQLALHCAETACGYEPINGIYLNTLRVAQYRVGEYRNALATLTRSNTLNGGREPADLAFLEMAPQGVGQMAQARRTLAQLRAVGRHPRRSPVSLKAAQNTPSTCARPRS